MTIATLLLLILSAGLASQWLAWRIQFPAIIVLIATGLLLGPVSGIIDPGLSQKGLIPEGAGGTHRPGRGDYFV